VFILKRVEVVCFVAVLQVFILKGVAEGTPRRPRYFGRPARNKKAAGSPPLVKTWCCLTIIVLEDVTKSQEKNPGRYGKLEVVGTIGIESYKSLPAGLLS